MNTNICTPVGYSDGFRGGGEEGKRYLRQPGREHMMDPEAEGQKAGADGREHDPRVADDRPLRKRRHDHRHQRDGRQEDDVDLGMSENPEQVLPQQWVAAPFRIEERPVEHTLHLEQQVPGNQRWKGEQDHSRDDQQIPGE